MPLPLRSALSKASHYGHAATALALFHAQQVAEEFVARHGRPEHLKSDAALYTPTSLMRVRIISSRPTSIFVFIHVSCVWHVIFLFVGCWSKALVGSAGQCVSLQRQRAEGWRCLGAVEVGRFWETSAGGSECVGDAS